MTEVIIIGAGAAGLLAAKRLAKQGVSVTLLEACARTGGRIHTITNGSKNMPVELGAEFIHGSRNDVWKIARAARLETREVPDRHWRSTDGKLFEDCSFWDELDEAVKQIGRPVEDRDVLGWLEQSSHLPNRIRKRLLNYVEGFHAAPAERMSLQVLAKCAAASGRDGGNRTFRLRRGYSEVANWLLSQAMFRNARLHLNTVVKRIWWEPGAVEIEAQTPAGTRLLSASRALVTIPLGALKGDNAVIFEPALPEKEKVIQSLEMGQVVKIILQFRSRFWPVNFGFIHSDDEWLPTWWSDERGLVLTGWTGGPQAEWLGKEEDGSILAEAFRSLSQIFKIDIDRIADSLVDVWRHDWTRDRFAGGAYSFTPVGNLEAPGRLGAPVSETLFFAGEATDDRGEQGTVQAALASGDRAAEEILHSLRRRNNSANSRFAECLTKEWRDL
jgi:monoamine oxidase